MRIMSKKLVAFMLAMVLAFGLLIPAGGFAVSADYGAGASPYYYQPMSWEEFMEAREEAEMAARAAIRANYQLPTGIAAFGGIVAASATPTGLLRVGAATRTVAAGSGITLATDVVGGTIPAGWGIVWSSSNPAIAVIGNIVSSGPSWEDRRLLGVAQGTAVVTAQLRDDEGGNIGAAITWTVNVNPFILSTAFHWNSNYETLFTERRGVMYALRFNPAQPERARWLPLVGSLNLSRVFPRAGRGNATIAIWVPLNNVSVPAMAEPGTAGRRQGRTVSLTLEPRQALDRNAVTYTPLAGGGIVLGAAPANVAAARVAINAFPNSSFSIMAGRAGVNGWGSLGLVRNRDVINAGMNPVGGNLTIRRTSEIIVTPPGQANVTLWATGFSNDNVITPASASVRIRIPAVPRSPNPRVRNQAIAISNRMEYVVLPLAGESEDDRNAILNAIRLHNVSWDNGVEYWFPATDDGTWTGGNRTIPWTLGSGSMVLASISRPTRGADQIISQPRPYATATGGGALQAGDVILVRTAATARAPASFVTAVVLTADMLS